MNKQQYIKEYESRRASRAEHAAWPHGNKNTLPDIEKRKEAEGKMKITKVKNGTIIKFY